MICKKYLYTVALASGSGILRKISCICKNQLSAIPAIEQELEGRVIDIEPDDIFTTEDYRTSFDNLPCHIKSGYAEQKKAEGKKLLEAGFSFIRLSRTGAWSAGGYHKWLTSYEVIGLHACTKDLFEGFVEAGLPILDYRIE